MPEPAQTSKRPKACTEVMISMVILSVLSLFYLPSVTDHELAGSKKNLETRTPPQQQLPNLQLSSRK